LLDVIFANEKKTFGIWGFSAKKGQISTLSIGKSLIELDFVNKVEYTGVQVICDIISLELHVSGKEIHSIRYSSCFQPALCLLTNYCRLGKGFKSDIFIRFLVQVFTVELLNGSF
jgi:hypothetical protein